VLHGVVV